MDRRQTVIDIFNASLQAVDPYNAVIKQRDKLLEIAENGGYNRIKLIGFGKAACPMAKAAEEIIAADDGIVITKYGHCDEGCRPLKISFREAGHPVPDLNGLRAAEELLGYVSGLDAETLVICLVSGGGSALLACPYKGIPLEDKMVVTDLLLKAGADIYELNTVRKHISGVKGGRLAGALYPARVVALLLSDVMGDRLDIIASGPTAPDPSTFEDTLNVITKYGLWEKMPRSILEFIEKGRGGRVPETPKEGAPAFEKIDNIIIGSNGMALVAAEESARSLGLEPHMLSSELAGEARDAGRWLAGKALEMKKKNPDKKLCLISGGETTVTVKGEGKGGRNTELALAFAIAVKGNKGIALLSAGTDGNDGPTDAAGAVVDGTTIGRAEDLGLDPQEYLDNNDSYTLFKKTDDLLITGPTGTNVMDVQISIVE